VSLADPVDVELSPMGKKWRTSLKSVFTGFAK
jgi:hypothetical protein